MRESWKEIQSSILKIVQELDSSSNFGPDGIPNIFIKNFWLTIREQIFNLYNQSLKSDDFPTLWKSVFVKPIFKNGDTHDVMKYLLYLLKNETSFAFDKA